VIQAEQFEEVTCIKMSLEAGGRPVYWAAAFLIDGLLIDTGPVRTSGELADFLDDRKLEVIVNTHYHEDHVGADGPLARRYAVPVLAHRDSVQRIAEVPRLNPYQEYVWGYPEAWEAAELGAFIETESYRFDVVETPGHSEGHIALVELDRGWCFSGDIFITERPKVIRADEDARGLEASMRMLAELPTERLVLFTSMGRIIEDGRAALLSCARYIDELGAKVGELSARGRTVGQITEELFGEGSSLAAMTSGHFSTENLIASLLP
jgi:glyoxylase-like metal-dependent hydrolase (beta-lactamase superfamily II)